MRVLRRQLALSSEGGGRPLGSWLGASRRERRSRRRRRAVAAHGRLMPPWHRAPEGRQLHVADAALHAHQQPRRGEPGTGGGCRRRRIERNAGTTCMPACTRRKLPTLRTQSVVRRSDRRLPDSAVARVHFDGSRDRRVARGLECESARLGAAAPTAHKVARAHETHARYALHCSGAGRRGRIVRRRRWRRSPHRLRSQEPQAHGRSGRSRESLLGQCGRRHGCRERFCGKDLRQETTKSRSIGEWP